MSILLFLFTMVTSIGCVHRLPTPERLPAQARASSYSVQNRNDLREILSKRLVRLNRPMITFHWDQGDPSSGPKNLEDLVTRLRGQPEQFFDVGNRGSNVGPGKYVATDTMASRNYGGVRPQLTLFTIAARSVLLNLSDEINSAETAWFAKVRNELGCDDTILKVAGNGIDAEFGNLRGNPTEACRRLVIDVVRDLDVGAILYSWGASSSLSQCRHARTECLNIIRRGTIDLDSLAYYDDSQIIESRPLAALVAQLNRESDRDPDLVYSDYRMPASLDRFTTEPAGYADWKAKTIFKCGRPWSAEGNSRLTRLEEYFFGVYQDQEVLNAIKDLKDAIRHRDEKASVAVGSLRILEQLQSTADANPLPFSFGDWSSLKDKLTFSNEAPVDTIARLGEKLPRLWLPNSREKFLSAIDSVLARDIRSRSVLPITYQRLGYGPRSTRLSVNDHIISMGGVPFLKGPLPTEDQSADLKDRKLYLKILRNCTEKYANPQLDVRSIRSGPCGTR